MATVAGTMAITATTTTKAGTTATTTTSSKEMKKAKQIILILRKSLMVNVTIVASKVTKKLIAIKIKERKNSKVMEM